MMAPFKVFAILTTFSSAVVEAGVFHLPIARTTAEFEWRFPDPFSHLLSFRERSSTPDPTKQSSDSVVPLLVAHDFGTQGRLSLASESTADDQAYADGDPYKIYWSIYTTPMSVGNPLLNFTALVDMSWSTLFVPSVNCTYNADLEFCGMHALYNSTESSTYKADLRPAMIRYFSGAGMLLTSVKLSRDSFHLPGIEMKQQIFEEATKFEPDPLIHDPIFDTALGLALHNVSMGKADFTGVSPFHSLVQQKLLDREIFCLKLSRNDDEPGELTLGGLPDGLEEQALTVCVPLDHTKPGEGALPGWVYFTSSGWQVSVVNISVGASNQNASKPILRSPVIAVISSSYPYISLPNDAVAEAHRQIGLSKEFDWVDCDLRPSLPNLTITFGPSNNSITLTPWDYLIDVLDKQYGQWRCVSSFVGLRDAGNDGFIMLGSPFLNGLYSVFDAANETISFANRPV